MAITLEQLLESVTDAISALVLFASEAGNNSVYLKNLSTGAQGVASAVAYLSAQAQGTVENWRELGSNEMADKMQESMNGMTNCVNSLAQACKDLSLDPHNPQYKNTILEDGKDMVKWMIGLLQQHDLYGVMLALKYVSLAQELLRTIDSTTFAVDDYALLLQAVGVQLDIRKEEAHEARTRTILNEAKSELEQLSTPFVSIVKRSWTDASFKQKIPIILGPLNESLEKAAKGIKLSAKSPFDLSMLDSDMSNFNFKDDELAAIVASVDNWQDALKAIKKAIQAGDEFELERAIRALEKDLSAQIAAAEKLAYQTADPYLRDEMLRRVNAAKNELDGLMQKLKQEANLALLSKDASKVEEILEGVRKMFNSLMEGKALNELTNSVTSLNALLDEIPPEVDLKNADEARALVKDVKNELGLQKVMAHVLIDDDDDEFRKNRVLNNVAKMEALGNALDPTVTSALQGDPIARNTLDKVIAGLKQVAGDLLTAASVTTPQELLERAGVINRSLVDLKNLTGDPFAHHPDIYNSKLRDLVTDIKAQADLANAWADSLYDDPEKAKDVRSQANALTKAAAKLVSDSKALLSGPQSGPEMLAAQKATLESIDKVSAVNKQLVHSAIDSPDELFKALQGKVGADGAQLKAAAKSRNVEALAQTLVATKADLNDCLFLAELMGLDLEDAQLLKDLLTASNRLANLMGSLVPNAKALAADPNSRLAEQNFDEYFASLQQGLSTIGNITDAASPEDQMVINAKNVSSTAKSYGRYAEKKDFNKSDSKLKDVKKKIAKQNQLAQIVAERCEYSPEMAHKIVVETAKLDTIRNELDKAVAELKKNPDSKEAAKKVKTETANLQKQAELTGQLAQDIKVGKKEAEERAKEQARLLEIARLEEEERKKLAAQALPIGIVEIYEAAQEVQNITQNLTIDTSPAGSLVALANKLAKAMEQLAAMSKTGTKQQLIALARQIADLASQIMSLIDAACQGCRDPHLCQEMRDMGHVSKNFAVQLKIICGVKANLILEDDPTVAQSLITCCQGMCRSVGEVVNLSQVAKLKPKK
eukprot:TRINITY_DN15337_c0_g1_i1.p1 TRINITY_DN15337_c0_g1~~TRINITY_DN15337_c0_g1_i1.p1  ORF type:complete len:1054 (-),score=338.62 TRINITY_DN15337_c0_g1_i1:36-3197(-)